MIYICIKNIKIDKKYLMKIMLDKKYNCLKKNCYYFDASTNYIEKKKSTKRID